MSASVHAGINGRCHYARGTCRENVGAHLYHLFVILFSLPSLLFGQSDQEKQLFEFVNSERLRERLIPLLWDPELYQVAFAHSKDMAAMRKTTHKGSDGTEPQERVLAANIFSSRTGENIARDLNVVSAHTSLMRSLDHRENILESDYTHAAVGIIKQNQFLYVTELFIHKISDYPVDQARQTLIKLINLHRQDKKLAPLALSESLSNAAQAHVEVQNKFDSLTPMLTIGSIARTSRGRALVTAYTATTLLKIPPEIRDDIESSSQKIGIGFKRIQGKICNGGCYLVVLVLA
jgi:uncharacterized protein YkwD